MTRIVSAFLPRTERGNDTNDHRDDPDYLGKAERPDPAAWAQEFIMTEAEIADLKSP